MDFSNVDILAFLKASMPLRFQDISPYDFEDFISEMFVRDGYRVTQTSYSGDFGADLIVEKDGLTTAVQVKRYSADVRVSVPDINQIIAARTYYDTDDALIITTSDFTPTTVQLAQSTEVFLWNWERLSDYISSVFMEGEDYYRFFEDELFPETPEEAPFIVRVRRIRNDFSEEAISALLELENTSSQNLMIHLELPILLTKKRKQVQAAGWQDGYFHDGMLLNESKVDVGCLFSKKHIREIKRGYAFVIRIHSPAFEQPLMFDTTIKSLNADCFIVTFCFGMTSPEYAQCIALRDHYLTGNTPGRVFLKAYYRIAPSVTAWCAKTERRQSITRKLFTPLLTRILRAVAPALKSTKQHRQHDYPACS